MTTQNQNDSDGSVDLHRIRWVDNAIAACEGMPDPAAEIARLREIEANAVIDPVGLIASQYKAIDSLQRQVKVLREALQGVVRVADRKTDEFDAARHALTSTEPKP